MMLNIRYLITLILLCFVVFPVYTQEITGITTRARVIDSDTVPIIDLPALTVVAPMEFDSRREERRHSRLVRNVKVAYPYAKLAGIRYREYSKQLEKIECKAERRKIMDQIEQKLLDEFGDDLKKLNFTQGLILIKLIDRETRHTSYDLLKDYRGMFRAFFWQSIGRLFGYDLRVEYDPHGEDKTIEHIIMMIEAGVI